MIAIKQTAGPNPYAGGGFTVTFGQFEKVNRAIVKCDQPAVLAVNNTAYATHVSIATNVVTIKVFTASTTGGGPNAYAELGAGNMAGRTWTVVADGE